MTFRFDFDQFLESAQALSGSKIAIVSKESPCRTLSLGANGLVIIADSDHGQDHVVSALKEKGFEPVLGHFEGISIDEEPENPPAFVAAVAYRSREDMPGLWMDSFPYEPNQGEVLKAIYDEFSETGTITEMTFEEFVQMGCPNVVILSPDDVTRFAGQKSDKS